MTDPRPPRTTGGSALRASIEEAQQRLADQAATTPFPGETAITAFAVYDRETGVEVGAAVHWQGPKGSEWTVTGALARKATAATSPYGVRLELRGRLKAGG